MQRLGVDIETYSDEKLDITGVFKYVESPAFDILLICYSIDGGKARQLDLQDRKAVAEFKTWLVDPHILKTAHNAAFERVCFEMYFDCEMPPEQWACTMIRAAMCGLPMGLEMLGQVLKLPIQKNAAGKALIRFFCMPCKPTRTNRQRTRNPVITNYKKFVQEEIIYVEDMQDKAATPAQIRAIEKYATDCLEKWNDFIDYCLDDVNTEQLAFEEMQYYYIPTIEENIWFLDQKINKRGLLLDKTLAKNAVDLDYEYNDMLTREITEITGLQNPNSPVQLKRWLSYEVGRPITSLTKESCLALLQEFEGRTAAWQRDVYRVIEIRQEMSKTSVKKYIKMLLAVCLDGRLRGMLQYYGAGTGRWAGRLIQPHNLPRISMKAEDLDLARRVVKIHDLDRLILLFGNIPDTLSQLIRTALKAAPGKKLIPGDYSAIEARVLAWLAREKWRLVVFEEGGDIYKTSAAALFGIPLEEITDALRQQGKVAELALGYQGGESALMIMDTKKAIPSDQYDHIKTLWRKASPRIVQYWYDCQAAAIAAIRDGGVHSVREVDFFVTGNTLYIRLPSGRCLSYPQPTLRDGLYGPSVYYLGADQMTRQWKLINLYGGKIVENIVQAVARDVLAHAMLRLDAAGHEIVLHVHDEIVVEGDYTEEDLPEIRRLMIKPITWAKGLPLDAKPFLTDYYKKD